MDHITLNTYSTTKKGTIFIQVYVKKPRWDAQENWAFSNKLGKLNNS